MNEYLEAEKEVFAIFEKKVPVRPSFVISYGPPGSGKSSILVKFLEPELNLKLKNCIEVNVDQCMEAIPEFKKTRDSIISDNSSNSSKEKTFRSLYEKLRPIGDSLSTRLVDRALSESFSVIFETTGRSVSYTERELHRARQLGYSIVLVFPLVDAEELLRRVQQRQLKSGQVAAPAETILMMIEKADQNFPILAEDVDAVYIYNNLSKEPRLILKYTREYTGSSLNSRGIVTSDVCECKDTSFFKKLGPNMKQFLRQHCTSCTID